MTTSFLIALLVLLGVGMMLWALDTRIAIAPTPTVTATRGPSPTNTPDFRATRVIEEILTQQAYQVAINPTLHGTPVPDASIPADSTPDGLGLSNLTPTPASGTPEPSPVGGAGDTDLTPTSTGNVVVLPIVAPNPEVTTTPTSDTEQSSLQLTDSPPPTPTMNQIALPSLSGGEAVTPTPTPSPTSTPPPEPPSPTASATQELVPEPPTSIPTFTPTVIPYGVNSLRAFVRENGAAMYIGASAVYTQTGTLASGDNITLHGRNETGEWVLACCATVATTDGTRQESGWVRQAEIRPTENALEANAPDNTYIDPNDVQWLPVQYGSSSVRPLVTITPIPAGDYPLYGYTLDNRARVPDIPNPPLNNAWPAIAQAGQSLISPVAVSGSSVLVASADNHIYSFDRTNGNQRWRYNLGREVRLAPVIFDRMIYLMDVTGRVIALEDQGNVANQLWSTQLPQPAISNFAIISDTLFISAGVAGGDEPQYIMYSIDRANGNIRDTRNAPLPGVPSGRPALSDQLLFIAAEGVLALDYRTYGVVWRRLDILGITTAPVYSYPGVGRLAELFVVNGANRIFSLNANTGAEYWNIDNGEPATHLAANDNILFVAGDGYVKAIRRNNREQLWRTPISGAMIGGPVVDNERVLVLTQNGLLQFLDANTGSIIGGGFSIPAAGAPAISPPWIFVPGTDGRLYALRQAQ